MTGLLKDALTEHADADHTPHLDLDAIVRTGDRRRRRRQGALTGLVAAAAVVALVATMVPRPDARTPEPPAGSPGRTTAAPDFTPLPGVPPGDQALADLGNAEVVRRCLLRGTRVWPDDQRLGIAPQSTGLTVITNKVGERPRLCTIPGDSQPSAALVAAAAADPLPADDARLLRNCAVKIWHDLDGWRVLAKDTQPGVGTNLVALSPSRRFVLRCTLTARGQELMDIGSIRPAPRSQPGRVRPTDRGAPDLRRPAGLHRLPVQPGRSGRPVRRQDPPHREQRPDPRPHTERRLVRPRLGQRRPEGHRTHGDRVRRPRYGHRLAAVADDG